MSTLHAVGRYSYDDYKSLSNATDKRYELLDGDLLVVPSPTTTHQRVLGNLYLLLAQHVNANNLGQVLFAPVDVVFGEGARRDVAQPDMLYVSHANKGVFTEGEVRGAPDLVVEILSPSTGLLDKGYKKVLYGRYKVSEYWLVDPQSQTIEVFALTEQGYRTAGMFRGNDQFESNLFPAFRPDLSAVFQLG